MTDSPRPDSAGSAETRPARALRRDPGDAVWHNDRANRLTTQGEYEQAAEHYRHALAQAPGRAALHYNLANVLAAAGRAAEALDNYRRALALDPDMQAAHTNLGNLLRRLERPGDAAEAYRRALFLDPGDAGARYNLGTALLDLGRPGEALAYFELASAAHAPAQAAAGEALLLLGRRPEARRWFEAACASKPDDAEARLGLAICQLADGDFAAGWAGYEARLQSRRQPVGLPEVAGDRLRPEHLASVRGKRVAVLAEQGFGDAIQMVRYLPLLRGRGAQVRLVVPPELRRLLAGVADAPGGADFVCPIMSLPWVFGTTLGDVPAEVPYLAADPAPWRARLGTGARHVGLAWSGNPAHRMDRERSLPLDALAPLLAVPGVAFHALQSEFRPAKESLPPAIRWHGETLGDFADTAGLVAAMDLVISVDTAVAHLAGALGSKLWLLLGRGADFRWLEGRADSPWYPTATLWRAGPGGWPALIARVAAALAEWA
jgi:Tfp pilus assembly protein PilF